MFIDRKDEITAQRVVTGLIFFQMLGREDAENYLLASGVSEKIVERVLARGPLRPMPQCISGNPSLINLQPLSEGFYCNAGRRRDVVKMAVVQAALALRQSLGVNGISDLMHREKIPSEVISRVLEASPENLRARR